MKKMIDSPKCLILILTSILFATSYWFDISQIIIMSLSFMILLEVVRTIYEYIVNPNHRVKMRYVIDGAILFGIRELFVGWVMLKTDLTMGLVIFGISILAIGILIFYRYKVIKSSPDSLEKCESCVSGTKA